MKMKQLLDRFHYLNELGLEKDSMYEVIHQYFEHAVEELGEVARCLRGKNDEPIQNEAIDVALTVLGLAELTADSREELFCVMERKLDKWQRRLEKK